MNKLLIITIFFLTSCTSNLSKTDFDFSYNMSFDDFKNKLLEYSESNPYPNIDY